MKFHDQRHDSDCLVACLASILGIEYEEVDTRIGMKDHAPEQWNLMQGFLARRGLVCWGFSLNGEMRPILMMNQRPDVRYHIFPTGHWLASVDSPRHPDEGHVVVMKGDKIIHDPHPRRDMGHKGFREGLILMPLGAWSL